MLKVLILIMQVGRSLIIIFNLMGCCVSRSKFEEGGEGQFMMLNNLPSYDNISQIYRELELPAYLEQYNIHKKERLIFMIVNLLRVRPKIFLQQMNYLKNKCDMR
jgi:hypothetical protein